MASQNVYIQERRDSSEKEHWETCLEITLAWQAHPHFPVTHVNTHLNDGEGLVEMGK